MNEKQSNPVQSPEDTQGSGLPLGDWLHSAYEDGSWDAEEGFDTKEKAITDAIYDYGFEVGDIVWVGQVAACTFPRGFVCPAHLDIIEESFEEKLGEEIGESSDGHPKFGEKEHPHIVDGKRDDFAWRGRIAIQKEVCRKIEEAIEVQMRSRGMWKDGFWFTLDNLEAIKITQEQFDQSIRENE